MSSSSAEGSLLDAAAGAAFRLPLWELSTVVVAADVVVVDEVVPLIDTRKIN